MRGGESKGGLKGKAEKKRIIIKTAIMQKCGKNRRCIFVLGIRCRKSVFSFPLAAKVRQYIRVSWGNRVAPLSGRERRIYLF